MVFARLLPVWDNSLTSSSFVFVLYLHIEEKKGFMDLSFEDVVVVYLGTFGHTFLSMREKLLDFLFDFYAWRPRKRTCT